MEHFSFSLLMSLLHSLWQAAVLVCFYHGLMLLFPHRSPEQKRNFLFLLLGVQVTLSLSTFIVLYNGSSLIDKFAGLSLSTYAQSSAHILSPWIVAAYLIVLLYKSTALIFSWQKFRLLGRSSWIKPSVDLRLFTKVKAAEFGIRRKVGIWYSHAVNTPLTFGFLKPVILLPVALVNHLSLAETEALIIHELNHIRSKDYVLNWALIICETIFFFNPFIKIIASAIKLEREKSCDTQVLNFRYDAIGYAETLLKAARFKSTPAPFFLNAASKNSQLAKRIHFFTSAKNQDFNRKNFLPAAMIPLLLLLSINMLFIQPKISNRQLPAYVAKHSFSTVIPTVASGAENTAVLKTTGIEPSMLNDHATQPVARIKKNAETTGSNSEDLLLQTPVKAGTEIISSEAINNELVVPVALTEPEISKEVIVKEENSALGKAVTRVYMVTRDKDGWKTKLLWMITESRSTTDSTVIIKDSTSFNQSHQSLQAQ